MTALSLIGSTGSAGTQTLEAVQSSKGAFTVQSLACATNIETLFSQITLFHPKKVAVQNVHAGHELQKKLSRTRGLAIMPEVLSGKAGIDCLAEDFSSDIVVLSMAGEKAVSPLLAGISAGKNIVLVNKEAVVCHGEKIEKALETSEKKSATIIPTDSEHSAIFRCLEERRSTHIPFRTTGLARVDISHVDKIIIPCSGGPFFGKTQKEIAGATLKEALHHPRWKMGKKILIDSASLVNKGLEVIEAHYLFGIPYEKIEVVAHPECQFHGAVFWNDGTLSALFHPPDMKYPLSYALYFAIHALPKNAMLGSLEHFHLSKQDLRQPTAVVLQKMCRALFPAESLTFFPIDHATFPAIRRAYTAGKAGGKAPAHYCRSASRASQQFLKGEISFDELLSP